MIAPTAIIRGIGLTFNMPLINVEGTTGYYNSRLDLKMSTALHYIQMSQYNFGFVHIKAVDDAGHDKNV